MKEKKTNRVAINIEDSVYEAFVNLAEREGYTVSEMGRILILMELKNRGLLPESTIHRLVGIR